jgi:RNA polymerase sigma-70 factor (ECF subfamily)
MRIRNRGGHVSKKQHFELFDKIYFETYQKVLKYIVVHCYNIDDVNDIIQETYLELHSLLGKDKVVISEDLSAYVIGIAKNKIKDLYRKKNKHSYISLDADYNGYDLSDSIASETNIEDIVIEGDNISKAWDFVKRKNVIIGKIFYLHYYSGMTIKQIARELLITESAVKNHLYRTLNELHDYFSKGVNKNVK